MLHRYTENEIVLGSLLGKIHSNRDQQIEGALNRTKTEDWIIFPQGRNPGKQSILTPKLDLI